MSIIGEKISKLISAKLSFVAVIVTVFCLNLCISKDVIAEEQEQGSSATGLDHEVPIVTNLSKARIINTVGYEDMVYAKQEPTTIGYYRLFILASQRW